MSDRCIGIGSLSLRLRGVPEHTARQVAGHVGEAVGQALAGHVSRAPAAAADMASVDLGRVTVPASASPAAIAAAVGRVLAAQLERGGG